jgi:hypothetical protein
MVRERWILAVTLAAFLAPAAMAQDVAGFRTPSGNIHCQYFTGDHDPTIRCDVVRISNRPPPRPRDCDLDWGQACQVSSRSARGERLCYGDTVQDPSLPALPYGESFSREGMTCMSGQAGVTCRNAGGHGFELSRGNQQVF